MPGSVPGAGRNFGSAPANLLKGRVHFAFVAKDRAAVRAFHAAALQVGGKDNGAPGLRPHYHDHYYGAFVLDPDGHNIEAVCHLKE
jgi:catechol 2,3-dioxygenase-like lactoylglutathione lyase family enzyme